VVDAADRPRGTSCGAAGISTPSTSGSASRRRRPSTMPRAPSATPSGPRVTPSTPSTSLWWRPKRPSTPCWMRPWPGRMRTPWPPPLSSPPGVGGARALPALDDYRQRHETGATEMPTAAALRRGCRISPAPRPASERDTKWAVLRRSGRAPRQISRRETDHLEPPPIYATASGRSASGDPRRPHCRLGRQSLAGRAGHRLPFLKVPLWSAVPIPPPEIEIAA
jgi:hypothetical protein